MKVGLKMKKIIIALLVFVGVFAAPNIVFASGPPYQSNSTYGNPSNSIPNDGTTTGTITIHLEDSSGNNVTSDSITLSSSNDGTAVFDNPQTTDGSGNATFTITSTTAGTTNVTLTDNTNAQTFTDWFTVNFYDASKGCSNVPATPVLSSVISNSNNTATLTWVDSADPVSNYLVSYGIASKNYVYGDSNIGSQGTTSFTVGSLSGNKKYYFAVAANNNCGASGFSNEVSAVVNPIPSTPTSTIEPTSTPDVTSAIVTDTQTDVPAPTDTPTPVPVAQDTNTTFRNLGIGILALGVVIIGSIFVIQKMKKKTRIPPMGGNSFQGQNPSIVNPPVENNIPQNPTMPPSEV
jgi:hypothetical protein